MSQHRLLYGTVARLDAASKQKVMDENEGEITGRDLLLLLQQLVQCLDSPGRDRVLLLQLALFPYHA